MERRPLKFFTRTWLYQELWKRPATQIAAELNVSPVWIGRLAKRNLIPRPPRGHWQKIRAGVAIRSPALPLPEYDPELKVEGRNQNWDYYRPSHSKHLKRQTPRMRSKITSDVFRQLRDDLKNSDRRNRGLNFLTKESFWFEVSEAQFDRAILLAENLTINLKQVGFEISHEEDGLRLWYDDVWILFKIEERTFRTYNNRYKCLCFRSECEICYQEPWTYHNTGELRVRISDLSCFKDTEKSSVEDRIAHICVRAMHLAERDIQKNNAEIGISEHKRHDKYPHEAAKSLYYEEKHHRADVPSKMEEESREEPRLSSLNIILDHIRYVEGLAASGERLWHGIDIHLWLAEARKIHAAAISERRARDVPDQKAEAGLG